MMGTPAVPVAAAGSTAAKPLSNPSALSVSAPKTVEKHKKDPKSKGKAKKSGKKFQLPSWTKWAVIGAAVLMVIASLLFTMTPKVDRNQQIIGQAVRI